MEPAADPPQKRGRALESETDRESQPGDGQQSHGQIGGLYDHGQLHIHSQLHSLQLDDIKSISTNSCVAS